MANFQTLKAKKEVLRFTVRQERVGDPVEVDDPLSVYMMDHLMLLDIDPACLYTLVIT